MALGTYQQVQFGDLANRLSARLGDPVPSNGPVVGFWTSQEVRSYLVEALRTWQAHSAFLSARASFPTSQGALFYETPKLIPQLSYTLTDRNLIQDIAFALQEPFTDGAEWTGTQFTFDAVVKAIQLRRDRFKVESGLGTSVDELEYDGGPGGTFEIPDNVIDIRRVMWKSLSGVYSILWEADQFALSAASPSWFVNPTPAPTDFSLVLQQPLALQLSPPPSDKGSVNFIALHSGGNLSPATQATILNIPDDLGWVVKFGALADLFGEDGIGKDPDRAAYCEERWNDGIQLARIYNTLKLGYLNGVPTFLDALEELDQAQPLWVSNPQGAPVSLVAKGSIVAVSPVADGGLYSITLDITPKFPIPLTDTDWIQLGQEYLDSILDYAEHLANLKVGAAEIKETYRGYQNFAKMAAVMNDRLRAQAGNFDVLSDRSRLSDRINPRRKSDLARKEINYENT